MIIICALWQIGLFSPISSNLLANTVSFSQPITVCKYTLPDYWLGKNKISIAPAVY